MPILALFTLLFVVFAGWIGKWKKDPFKTGGGTGPAAFAASGVGAPASTGYFTVGSTRKEVRAVQGMPTWVQGDTWHYGSSRVQYKKGRVKGWASSPDHPLRARLSPSDGPATAIGGIRIGSTKEEILRLNGTPTRLDDDVWEYGYSKIYFSSGRVSGWADSKAAPLRVDRGSGKRGGHQGTDQARTSLDEGTASRTEGLTQVR
jgi:hypothetical protein